MCYLYGAHLSPLGFAACQSKKCTNTAAHAAWIEAEQAAPPIYANVRIINE